MKNFRIRITENTRGGKISDFIVGDKTLSYLERLRYFGGFMRFSIDLYEDNVNKKAQNAVAEKFAETLLTIKINSV